MPITLGEAMRGATIRVPTPTGAVSVKVPAGAASGTKLRLRGRGVQAKSGAGDLYLILRPTPPQSDDEAVLAAVFPKEATDLFFLVFTIPNSLRMMLAEGAVSAAVVPMFSEVREKEGEEDWPVSPVFGKLTRKDYGVLSYRHLDHHLTQFGA